MGIVKRFSDLLQIQTIIICRFSHHKFCNLFLEEKLSDIRWKIGNTGTIDCEFSLKNKSPSKKQLFAIQLFLGMV